MLSRLLVPHAMRAALLASTAIAGLLVGGCGNADDDAIVLEFWAMGGEGERVAELMPAFEAENPGIKVKVQQIPWTAAHEKLLTAYAGRATPDICQLGNTWVAELAALNALEPLDPFVARSAEVNPEGFFPGIWATNVIEGALFGVPWYVDTRLLFYRRDILAEAGYDHVPDNWADWLEAMRAVKRTVGDDRFAILIPINEFEPLLVFGLQAQPNLLRDGDRYGDFRGAAFREAFDFYLQLFEEQLAPPASNTQIANVWQEFGNGLFTFYISGPWNISEFEQRMPDSLKSAWSTAPIPGPTGPGVSTAGGSSLAIFKASEHKEAAWKLIEYLSRTDIQATFYEMIGDLPARTAAWDTPALADNEYAAAFRDQLTRVQATPKVPEQERIVQKLREYAEFVVLGRMTADEALTALDRDVDDILEKRRYLLERQANQ